MAIAALKLSPATVANMEPVVFHIVDVDEWSAGADSGDYAPKSLAVEGFIHLSQRHQIVHAANLFYRGQTSLCVLSIVASRLRSRLVYEPGSAGEDALFPHLYGPLNRDAVRAVSDFPCGPDGYFGLPETL